MSKLIILSIVGSALSSGDFSYAEKHRAFLSPDLKYQKIETTYLDKNGEQFGSLHSDFSKHSFLPNYEFKNSNIGLVEKVQISDDKKKLQVEVSLNGKFEKYSLPVQENAVMGQGFHNFILENLQTLLIKPIEVKFIIPRKKDFFNFVLRTERLEKNKVHISMVPSSFILKVFLKKLVVTYDLDSKRLLKFDGLTNVEDQNGTAHEMVINFDTQLIN